MGNTIGPRYFVNSVMSIDSAFNRIFHALEKGLWEESLGSFIRLGPSTDKFPYSNVLINKNTKALLFQLALAGYRPEDIKITFEDDKLIVSSDGVKNQQDKDSSVQYLEQGIKCSSFKVSFALSPNKYHNDPDHVQATFDNGILSILVPAKEESKPKQISIKTGDHSKLLSEF